MKESIATEVSRYINTSDLTYGETTTCNNENDSNVLCDILGIIILMYM